MALTWEWKEKCGEITLEQKNESGDWRQFPLSLYKGNAFLIMLAENDADNTYQVFGFFADKEHAKACLGLTRSKSKHDTGGNLYDTPYMRFTKIRLNKAKYPYAKELVSLLAQAFDNITIEIYSEEEKPE